MLRGTEAAHNSAAGRAALDTAARSQATAQEYAAQARLALDRSELMLRAAEDLADTAGLADVAGE